MRIPLIAVVLATALAIAANVIAAPVAIPALGAQQGGAPGAIRNARCDGSTDDTAAILAAGRSARGLLVVPSGCRFDRQRLLDDLPPDAIILDLSIINGFASEGETTKSLGVLASDTATNDTQWLIGSGHHPVLNLNNFGSSRTDSAGARRASLLWSVGDFSNGDLKTGYRGAGILQFGRETGRDEWSLSLRSLAPWRAVEAGYEIWAPGERIGGAGVYRSTGQALLVSTSGGVTGRATPEAAFGQIVNDGSVTWRFVDSSDRSLMRINENGHVLFGLGDFSATFRSKVSPYRPGGNVAEWAASGPFGDVLSKFLPTDGSGAEVPVPALRASARGGLAVVDGRDYNTPIVQFDAARGMTVSQVSIAGTIVTVEGSSLDVSGKSLLFMRAGRRRTVSALTGGADGQVVTLHFLDGNTTLDNGTGRDMMHLAGSRAFASTTDSVLVLRKLPAELGGRWVETSRSVK